MYQQDVTKTFSILNNELKTINDGLNNPVRADPPVSPSSNQDRDLTQDQIQNQIEIHLQPTDVSQVIDSLSRNLMRVS